MKIFITILFLIILTSCGHLPFGPKEKPIIHSGHFLFSKLSRVQNEEILSTMENKNYSLVNLTLDDLLIAKSQGIELEKFQRLLFLNSTIIDLEKDSLYSGTNVVPYFILNDICFIGLSDNNYDIKLFSDHFLMDDYVLALLKIKNSLKNEQPNSYVIIHKLGKDFDTILKRLPEDFRALLTN